MVPMYLEDNLRAQQIARDTFSELFNVLHVGMSEKDICDFVCSRLKEKGSGEFWYHGCGALVLLGERSRISISGKEYVPDENNRISSRDVVTVDCSPSVNGAWGDYARTFFIENGVPVPEDSLTDPEFKQGLDAELHLHHFLTKELNPDMTYEELYLRLTEEIQKLGFINLDFHGNLGHSIETDEKDRIYIEKESFKSISKYGKPFTLEPHIGLPDGKFAYKRENIYYFVNDWFACL